MGNCFCEQTQKLYKILSIVGNANYYAIRCQKWKYKPRLKKYWNNIISTLIGHKWTNTHVHKFWFPFTWANLHKCKICVYTNWNLHLVSTRCKFQEFAYGCKFCICVQIYSHGQICTLQYICKSVHVKAALTYTQLIGTCTTDIVSWPWSWNNFDFYPQHLLNSCFYMYITQPVFIILFVWSKKLI